MKKVRKETFKTDYITNKIKNMKNKIKVYMDGPKLNEINKDYDINIDGYTFNPSLFKKNGATDYLGYSKKILELCSNKPVSLEVFADDKIGMIEQGLKLHSLSENVYVKIPITFTNGKSTISVIDELLNQNVKLNITAIFTLDQIKNIIDILKNSETILSIFAGRIYDCGVDAKAKIKEMNEFIKEKSKCKSLWASTRMSYDFVTASEINTDIITMQISHIEKLKMFGLDLNDYSLRTVKQFFDDAKSSGFKM
jgi:transaldolase